MESTVWIYKTPEELLLAYNDNFQPIAEDRLFLRLNKTISDIYPEGWKAYLSATPIKV